MGAVIFEQKTKCVLFIRDKRVCRYLLREMKAAYSILCVEPGAVNLLGVSSTKIMCGLDRAFLSFSWMIFSLKVICWSVFLRCLYQPITLSCKYEARNRSVSAEAQNSLHVYRVEVLPAYCLRGFSLQPPRSPLPHCCRSYKCRNQDKKNMLTARTCSLVIFDRSGREIRYELYSLVKFVAGNMLLDIY